MYSTDTGRPILLKYGSIRDLAGGPVALEVERFIRYASTKVHDAYSVHPTYSILQGIQLELQSGRTRSDRRQKELQLLFTRTFFVMIEVLLALA